jgi:hypothetical protein
MKRLAILAMLALAQPAHAQITVHDPANLVQTTKSAIQQLQIYARQLQQLQQEVQTAVSTGQMVAGAIQHPSLGAITGLMNMAGLGSALPVNPYAVQSILAGRGNVLSLPGQLGSLINGSFASNNVYDCQDNTFTCQQMREQSAGAAGMQGMAMNELQSVMAHLGVLTALREAATQADDPAKRENVLIALNTESAWATQEQLRLTSMGLAMDAQRDAREQMVNQKLHKDLRATIAEIPE